jgi:hypothetical protein
MDTQEVVRDGLSLDNSSVDSLRARVAKPVHVPSSRRFQRRVVAISSSESEEDTQAADSDNLPIYRQRVTSSGEVGHGGRGRTVSQGRISKGYHQKGSGDKAGKGQRRAPSLHKASEEHRQSEASDDERRSQPRLLSFDDVQNEHRQGSITGEKSQTRLSSFDNFQNEYLKGSITGKKSQTRLSSFDHRWSIAGGEKLLEDTKSVASNNSLYKDPTPALGSNIRKRKIPVPNLGLPIQSLTVAGSSQDIPSSQAQSQEPYLPAPKKRYRSHYYLDDGLVPLATLAWRESKARGDFVTQDMSESHWRALANGLLCSMHSEVLEQLVHGNLAEAYRSFKMKSLTRVYDESPWQEAKDRNAPNIYVKQLCNTKTGCSPSPDQMLKVIARMRSYVLLNKNAEEIQKALAVDNTGGRERSKERQVRKGEQFFTQTNNEERIQIIKDFCYVLSRTLSNVPEEDRNTPIKYGLYYVGYALCFAKRKAQHDADNGSSSWFMNFMKAVLIAELDDDDKATWGFDDYVVCYCISESEVPVAEQLITLVSSGYYNHGWGLCVHPAGENVASSALFDWRHGDVLKLWKDCAEFRAEHTPHNKNIDREAERMQQYDKR